MTYRLGDLVIDPRPVSIVYRDGSRGVLLEVYNRGSGHETLVAGDRVLRVPPGTSYHLVKTIDGLVVFRDRRGERLEVSLTLPRPRRFRIYVVPTVHTDIGYTDLQERVSEIHRENLEKALDIVYSRRSRFVIEVLWQLWQAPELLNKIVEAGREGLIGVQGLPMNLLTGLLSHEEIVRALYPLRELRSRGVGVVVAALNDVPSAVWSLPSILAASGIRYYVQAVNPDRAPICFINRELGGPYIWRGPDGSGVVAWFSGCYRGPMPGFHGYHQGKWAGLLEGPERAEAGVALFLWYHESRGYPLDKILMYGVFGDNERVVDRYIDTIEELRKRWVYPEIVVATTEEFFRDLEEEISSRGLSLRELTGSLGTYWEDGAASSARELSLSRLAKRLLFLAEVSHVFDYLSGSPYPSEELSEAWRNILLFDEHTWGAWNSVSEPHSPGVVAQWEVKRGYVLRALEIASRLAEGAYVSNPYPYEVEGIVDNTYVRIPPTSSILVDRKSLTESRPRRRIETEFYEIELEKGSVAGVYDRSLGREILSDTDYGLGEVVQVLGGGGSRVERTILDYMYSREPPEPVLRVYRETWSRLVSVEENDDVVYMRSVGRTGEIFFERRIGVSKRHKEIVLEVALEKPDRYEKEAVYIVFPMRRPERILLEEPGVFVDYSREYAPGACREWFTVNNIVILEGSPSTAIYTEDAPLVTVNDVFRGLWRGSPEPPNGLVFSYIMNNYWHTNYRASQSGVFRFTYRITSAEKIKPSHAVRFFSRPLRGRRVRGDLSIDPPEAVVTAIKKWDLGDGVVVRLLEVDNEEKNIKIRSSVMRGMRVSVADPLENITEDLGVFEGETEISLRPRSYTTLVFRRPGPRG